MNYITITLSVGLLMSLALNGVFIWYIRKLIQNIVLYTEGVDLITESIDTKLVDLNSFARKDLILNDPDVAHVISIIKESKTELEQFRSDFTIVDSIENNIGEEIDE